MNIEAFSRCKYRAVDCPGDDVPFILPGIAIGLFDGATDAKGALINSTPAGRMAALNAAECTAQLLIRICCRACGFLKHFGVCRR